jgi:NADPH2:quinone reductase
MKAIQITEFGGTEAMKYIDLPDPIAGEHEVVLDVTAIGINYSDTHKTENTYLFPQKLPMIPGIEVVGLYNGNRYLAIASSGGYAQKVVAHKSTIFSIPDRVTDQQALCVLIQGTTAWHLLNTMGNLKRGQSVVIHAAAGGVGTIAIQLAKMWGAKVIAVTSSAEKATIAKSLGADIVIDADNKEIGKSIRQATGGGADLILEMVGGKTFDQSLLALNSFGKLITFGMASRTAPTPINHRSLMYGSKTVSGFWLANCFGKKEMLNDVVAELFQLVADGKLKPVIGATYPLSEAADAHRSMLARKSVGKIVLDPRL